MGRTQGVIRRAAEWGRRLVASGLAVCAIALLCLSASGCAKPVQPTELISEPTPQPNRLTGQMAEVSPPAVLETLKQIIDAYTPQVRILSPRPGEVLSDTSTAVRLQVRGLPLFKDDTYQLGPHLHLFLDNEPYRAIYDLSQPITLEGLSPGTHTLRVFASRPWHESFKNQGAFDQRTFHVVAPTPQNELNASAPLLTYSRPQGSYGAEPIMLDFYLTNAPLHMSAQADSTDDLHDWRIRCTVNDQSFVFDQWQPIWLKGFKPGRNWVQLELIDETGTPIDNRFNNTVRIIDYEPGGTDTLSRLVRGELDFTAVAGIIDPTYVPPVAVDDGEAAAAESAESNAADAESAVEPGVAQPEDAEIESSDAEAFSGQPRSETKSEATPETSLPSAQSMDERPNPFLRPEPSPEAALAPSPEAPEPTLIDEIQDILDDVLTDLPKQPDPVLPDLPLEVSPPPAAADRPTLPSPEADGVIDRFKRWREKSPGSDPVPAVPDPIDPFAVPQPKAIPDAEPSLPQSPAPMTPIDPPTAAPPSFPEGATPDPIELPRIEVPAAPEPARPVPRSPLAPEVRPFI